MPKTKPAPSPWSNSIVRYADADPATLTANPQNWRQHPATQPDETRHSHAREVIRVPGVQLTMVWEADIREMERATA